MIAQWKYMTLHLTETWRWNERWCSINRKMMVQKKNQEFGGAMNKRRLYNEHDMTLQLPKRWWRNELKDDGAMNKTWSCNEQKDGGAMNKIWWCNEHEMMWWWKHPHSDTTITAPVFSPDVSAPWLADFRIIDIRLYMLYFVD